MHWMAILGIALANNLDNLGVGVAYGIARIRVSLLVNLWISLLTFAITALAVGSGSRLASYLPLPIAHAASALFLCGMGFWMLLPSFQGKRQPAPPVEPEDRPSLRNILADPTAADRDHSRAIDVREATFLGVALSLNNIGVGFSAGLLHLSVMATAICSAAVSFLALWLGARAGRRLGAAHLGERAQALAGLLLVVIGLCQFR
jgi:putative sporulation protein YtaF